MKLTSIDKSIDITNPKIITLELCNKITGHMHTVNVSDCETSYNHTYRNPDNPNERKFTLSVKHREFLGMNAILDIDVEGKIADGLLSIVSSDVKVLTGRRGLQVKVTGYAIG